MPITKYFTFAMLVIFAFMTNANLWGDNSNWPTHELEHSIHVVPTTAATDHIALHDAHSKDVPSVTSGLVIEHELLHAADHLQLFLNSNVIAVSLSLPRIIAIHFNFLQIPQSTYDAPFRPPRISSLPPLN